MEPIYAGWLSILPPLLSITLALVTKNVIFSLFLGILSGTITYCILLGLNPFVGPVEVMFQTAINHIDLYIIFFVFLLGALVQVIAASGGSNAYGRWADKYIKTKKATLLSTMILGILIFVDDYFNCLTVGTVMSPLIERHKISRAKLAYLIDSTAAPICIIAPISSWAAAVGSTLQSTGAFKSDMAAFCATIPYNLYALLTIFMVFLLSCYELDFGPMLIQEQIHRSKSGSDFFQASSDKEILKELDGKKSTVLDMVLPIIALILFAILGMLYNGGFWNAESESFHSLTSAFGNCSASQALCWGGLGALIITFFLYIPRKLMKFSDFMFNITEGIKNMVSANMILLFAWTISGVCRNLLMTADFVSSIFAASHIPGALLPAIIFILAAFLSFSIGSSWGTFSILIPIIIPVASILSPNLLIVSLSATLGGSIFGDHCSPISDTTILSSTGAGCEHLIHVSTQMPYSICVASCCIIGYLVAGFSNGNLLLTLSTGFLCLIISIITLHHLSLKKVTKHTV